MQVGDDAFAVISEFAFAIPALSGFGEHWQLNEVERDTLAKDLTKAAATLPKGKLKQAVDWLKNLSPWLALVGTISVITYPRYLETKRLANESANTPHGGPFNSPNVGPRIVRDPEQVAPDPIDVSRERDTSSGGSNGRKAFLNDLAREGEQP